MSELENMLPATTNTSEADEQPEIFDMAMLRRVKVRELVRMGYSDPEQISLILEGGISTGRKLVKIPCSPKTIKEDMLQIQAEDMAKAETSSMVKRGELVDKLYFLYQKAYNDYLGATGKVKATFLNSAFTILKSIIAMEGVATPHEAADTKNDAPVMDAAKEVNQLEDNERERLIAALEDILEQRKDDGGSGKNVVAG